MHVNRLDPYEIRLKVGFEVHQQLATKEKLFCPCSNTMTDEYHYEFRRRLRPVLSELGEYDKATLFEFSKRKVMRYLASKGSSCLVEMDEEPPHDINREALDTALIIALALNARIIDEIHVMRKIVIDGSNTTGFQRTMLIATDGILRVKGREIKVQSICLEEDAARLISDDGSTRTYALDRLGVPLVEIALEPINASIDELVEVALTLGRLLRASRRVARGLGTIRQDVNISILGSDNVVEVKGVQRLDQLRSVIEYEMYRQYAMHIIADRLRNLGIQLETSLHDVTHLLINARSKVIRKALDDGGVVKALSVRGLAGIFAYEPFEGIRLGKELSELVRFYGLGGIFHSDELPAYGITDNDVDVLRRYMKLESRDAFILFAGPEEQISNAVHAVIERLKQAFMGVASETRAATPEGKTIYLRPRPGSARMYPETDIPPIPISRDTLARLGSSVPKPWDEYVDELSERYGINRILAEKVFDSEYFELFEELASNIKSIQPSFIASTLSEGIISLEREGLDVSRLKVEHIKDVFYKVDKGEVAKESILEILALLMRGKAGSVEEAISILGIKAISEEELVSIINSIIDENMHIVKSKGINAINPLMGLAMSRLRGRVDGSKVNLMIRERILSFIDKEAQ